MRKLCNEHDIKMFGHGPKAGCNSDISMGETYGHTLYTSFNSYSLKQ